MNRFPPLSHARLSGGLAVATALSCLCTAALSIQATPATSRPSWPPLAELASKLRSSLPTLPEPDAALTEPEAYVRALAPWVLPPNESESHGSQASLLKTNLYPGRSGYVRVGTVDPSLPAALRAAVAGLLQEGPLSGLVLDLRFANGTNFGAAFDSASTLGAQGPQEYRLGAETWRTRPSESPPAVPILILVNGQTRQAAEALASAARTISSRSLLLGTNTAGQARAYRPVAMTDSLSLQVAAEPLLLPDGSEFPAEGLKPDLVLTVSEDDERAYAKDEYRRVAQGKPMVSSGPGRLNEAELVRRRRLPRSQFEDPLFHAGPRRRGAEGEEGDGILETEGDQALATVQDPALGLALDLIAGAAADTSASTSSGDSR